MTRRVIGVYLDTVFLLNLLRKDPPDKFAKAWGVIASKRSAGAFEAYIGHFTLMECLDRLQMHEALKALLKSGKWLGQYVHSEPQRIEKLLPPRAFRRARAPLDRWLEANQGKYVLASFPRRTGATDFFELAQVIAKRTAIRAPDVIQTAAALVLGADIILTDDHDFRNALNDVTRSVKSAGYREILRTLLAVTGVHPHDLALVHEPDAPVLEALLPDEFVQRFGHSQ